MALALELLVLYGETAQAGFAHAGRIPQADYDREIERTLCLLRDILTREEPIPERKKTTKSGQVVKQTVKTRKPKAVGSRQGTRRNMKAAKKEPPGRSRGRTPG